jgi:Protein of unknown function (DUF3551)
MRAAITAFGALVVLAVGPVTGRSAEHPWCTEFDPFTRYCSFASYRDCIAVANSVGATCVRNGQYHEAPPKPARHKPPRKQN